MKKEMVTNVMSVVVSMLAVTLGELIPGPIVRLVFIISVAVTVILWQSREKIQNPWLDRASGAIGLVALGILVVAVVRNGFAGFKEQLTDFGIIKETVQEAVVEQAVDEDETNQEIIALFDANARLEDKIDVISGNIKEYGEVEQQLEKVEKELELISSCFSEYYFWESGKDSEEVEEICESIPELIVDEEKNNFPNLQEDVREVELFYKMYLSSKLYCYCNIIDAFEMYGIDCEEMEIDEQKLVLWDVERLFAVYAMYKDAENLEKNVSFESKSYKYDDYKIIMSEYSDTLDYGGFRQSFSDCDATQISNTLDSIIMAFYKKLNKNFNVNLE